MESISHKKFYLSWVGCLTFLSGAVNICALILLEMTISHFTGNISKAAILLASGDFSEFSEIFSYIILFFVGSTISGYINFEKKLGICIYDAILPLLFGIMIFVTNNLTTDSNTMLKVISLGMGIQNGTYCKIKGILVRTTHMTGYLTDAGFCLGAILRGKTDETLKFLFYIISILTFFLGGFISYLLINRVGFKTLELMAFLYCILGLFVGACIFKWKQEKSSSISV